MLDDGSICIFSSFFFRANLYLYSRENCTQQLNRSRNRKQTTNQNRKRSNSKRRRRLLDAHPLPEGQVVGVNPVVVRQGFGHAVSLHTPLHPLHQFRAVLLDAETAADLVRVEPARIRDQRHVHKPEPLAAEERLLPQPRLHLFQNCHESLHRRFSLFSSRKQYTRSGMIQLSRSTPSARINTD